MDRFIVRPKTLLCIKCKKYKRLIGKKLCINCDSHTDTIVILINEN